MFQLALEILRENETELIKCADDSETLRVLSEYTQKIYEGRTNADSKVKIPSARWMLLSFTKNNFRHSATSTNEFSD